MWGWQVKLCDPLVTHGPHLSALEVRHDEALYKSTFTLLYFTLTALVYDNLCLFFSFRLVFAADFLTVFAASTACCAYRAK